ncbi:unnamed protein product [Euphydryas editha]|uniref:Uncharacterized protein n=1 Tax=Euphydryas editha TaxID=104508 RepID=A0AAU9TVY4_EUPED|nr:unnamed protein product [Euphydryas editha]
MESLYSLSEEQFAKSIISTVSLDQHVVALAKVTELVQASDVPKQLRPNIIIRALRILRALKYEENLLDHCFKKAIPHPNCDESDYSVRELWQLPREHEWLFQMWRTFIRYYRLRDDSRYVHRNRSWCWCGTWK